jgi:HPr kinase/phosphorylase
MLMSDAKVAKLVTALKLNVIEGMDWLEKTVETSDIHRPALEVAGYFAHYPAERIQVIGQTESDFFEELGLNTQRQRAEKLIQANTPCLIFSRGLQPHSTILDCARKVRTPVLGTSLPTTRLFSRLAHWLDNTLAPRRTMHGVFVELFGVGVLLTGASGIGKSETALELIKRGHRLVADDAVEIRRPAEDVLVGTSPAMLANLMEIRGLGIIDVCNMFGAGAVRPDKRVELVLHFEKWKEGGHYDRLGFDTAYQDILGVKVPAITVPVAPGRNLAMIVETAAVNYRAKTMGFDAGKDLTNRITEEMRK